MCNECNIKLALVPLQLQLLADRGPCKNQVKKGKTWDWWMRDKQPVMMEPVRQDVKYQYWRFLKKESSYSVAWGEHILSECKGLVQRGGISLHVVTNSLLEMCLQCDQLSHLMDRVTNRVKL